MGAPYLLSLAPLNKAYHVSKSILSETFLLKLDCHKILQVAFSGSCYVILSFNRYVTVMHICNLCTITFISFVCMCSAEFCGTYCACIVAPAVYVLTMEWHRVVCGMHNLGAVQSKNFGCINILRVTVNV